MRVYKNGDIRYVRTIIFETPCETKPSCANCTEFTCAVTMESYAHTEDTKVIQGMDFPVEFSHKLKFDDE